jgi:hypothetical protein
MLDFLKSLVAGFVQAVATVDSDRPVAIVLDNSPGYVGIAPIVQEWLTDLGPETGKFLVVTSLDIQDLRACAMAVDQLQNTFRSKWETSRQYQQAIHGDVSDGSNIDIKRDQRGFFVRLAETSPRKEPSAQANDAACIPGGGELQFYHQWGDRDVGLSYAENPSKYLAAVANRVPRTVFKGRRAYHPEIGSDTANDKMATILSLLGGSNSRDWSQRMIAYDEYVEFQFL